MENQNQKPAVGWGKEIVTNNGSFITFSVSESKLRDAWFDYNGDRHVRLKINKLKESNQYGKTHVINVNEWQPKTSESSSTPVETNNNLPF